MEFVKTRRPDMGRRLAAGCRRLEREGVPRGAALEVVLERDMLERWVPHAVMPAMDAQDARETLSDLLTELREVKLIARAVGRGTGGSAADFIDPAGKGWTLSPQVDLPVRAWMEALKRFSESEKWPVDDDRPPEPPPPILSSRQRRVETRVLKFRRP
jgi:hypothetical protein